MKYELFVLLPNLEEGEIKIADKEIREIIEKNSGSVVDFYEFGKRKLSYVIKKIRQGFYLDYAIEIETENLKKLDRELKLNNTVLRFDLSCLEGKLNKVVQEDVDANNDSNTNEYHANDKNKKVVNTEEFEKKSEDAEVVEEKKEIKKKKKVDMDELDEKLDELIKE